MQQSVVCRVIVSSILAFRWAACNTRLCGTVIAASTDLLCSGVSGDAAQINGVNYSQPCEVPNWDVGVVCHMRHWT